MKIWSELRRREVLRMAALYLVTAWLVMQVAEVVIALVELPSLEVRLLPLPGETAHPVWDWRGGWK